MEVEFIKILKQQKLRKFLMGLGVVTLVVPLMTLFCDNSEVATQSKELKNNHQGKHIERKYYLICEIVQKGYATVENLLWKFW